MKKGYGSCRSQSLFWCRFPLTHPLSLKGRGIL